MWDQPFTGYAFRQFEGKPLNAGSHRIYSHSSIWVSTVPGKLELQKASPTARAQGGGKRRAGITIGKTDVRAERNRCGILVFTTNFPHPVTSCGGVFLLTPLKAPWAARSG